MNMYETIAVRQSVRDYLMKPLEEQMLVSLQKFINELIPLFPDVPYEIEVKNVLDSNEKIKKALFSIKAPYYISIVTKDTGDAMLNAGFVMEQIALFLNMKGIGSCYQGNVKILSGVKAGYKEALVLAMGYPLHYLYREENKAKRLPLGELCAFKEEADKSTMAVLRAARMAPSAINRQPWRFVVYSGRIHVFLKKETKMSFIPVRMQYLDMGIALAHMVIAAEELWLEARLEVLDNISSQTFKNNQYITSMLFPNQIKR